MTCLYSIYSISVDSLKEALDLVNEAIGRTGYGERIKIAIDAAATDFCIGDVIFAFDHFTEI